MEAEKLLVIPACGLPGAPTDHTGAMACFAAGSAAQDRPRNTGWIGRLALALGGSSSQMVVGSISPAFEGAPHYKMLSSGRGHSLPPQTVANQALIDDVDRLFGGRDTLAAAFNAGRRQEAENLNKLLVEARQSAASAMT